MRFVIIFTFLFVDFWAISVNAVTLKPGENYTAPSGEVVTCAPQICVVEWVYVGSNYAVKLPDGKVFASYPTRDEALGKIKDLIKMKLCHTVQLKDKPQ